jgi:quinohemoprotein ethanol dehydrogenase
MSKAFLIAAAPLLSSLVACERPPATPAAPGVGAPAPTPPTASASAPTRPVADVDDKRLVEAPNDSDNWLSHGRSYDEQRFSPLTQIDATSVKDLGLAWWLDLDTDRGQEATPLVVDGVMYSTSAWSKVQAIDAVSGKLLWQYDPQVPGETGVRACCDAVNRGVAVWKGKVYVGTLDGRLVAIDAKSGQKAWSALTVDAEKSYTITGAPRIVKGKVIIGNGGAEFGVRGYVSAYDAESGNLAWRFYTVPGDPSKPVEAPILKHASTTWKGEWWKHGGGGTVWDSLAYDPELDLLYVGTGNGSPWNPRVRSPGGGDNLFLSSIIALRPDTGEYVWHYQTTPGDAWDYTATQHMILANLQIGGQPRKVLMQAPKNGFFYVLDRATGKLLSADAYVQLNWAKSVDLSTGRPVVNPQANYATTGKPWLAFPGPIGGHNWQPMSFSQKTGLVYIPVIDAPFAYLDEKGYEAKSLGFNIGINFLAAGLPQDPKVKAQVMAMVHGYLKAWDPVAKKEVWRVEYPGAWNSGILSTAGDLVFQGTMGGQFVAYGAKDGAKLWSTDAQSGVVAAPMTYAVKGTQYVAVVVGWGGTYALATGELGQKGRENVTGNKGRVLVFKLGGTATLPPAPPRSPPLAKPPAKFGDDKVRGLGMALYARFCSTCHGDSAVSAGVLPDLRRSLAMESAARWKPIVLDGALKDRGMVSFSKVLTAEQAEAVRAYVVARANEP